MNQAERRLIIHVGPHKTGTTYIQKRLIDARPLLKKMGFHYPEFGISQFGHHRIVRYFSNQGNDDINFPLEILRENIPLDQNIIISSENFVTLNEIGLNRIANFFPTHKLEIVFFIRDLAGLWPSYWQENIKHGADYTFLEYMAWMHGWMEREDVIRLETAKQLRELSGIFGINNIYAHIYDNVIDDDQDLFVYFWQNILNLPLGGLEGGGALINRSVESHTIEIIRILNQLYKEREEKSPGGKLGTEYLLNKALYQDHENFEMYVSEFERYANIIRIRENEKQLMVFEDEIVSTFGGRIFNKGVGRSLFKTERREKTVVAASRYWFLKPSVEDFMESTYQKICRTSQSPRID